MKKLIALAAILALVAVSAPSASADDVLTITPLPSQGGGTLINTGTGVKLAFHGSSPVVQRSGTDQAAVSTAALTVSSTFNSSEVTALATRCTALTVLVNELRAALVQKGLIKGAP